MHDDQDFIIRRLFSEQDQILPSVDFMLKLGKRIEERRRAQRVYRVLALGACVVLLGSSAPWVAQGTSNLIELTAMGLRAMSPLLYHPLTLFVAGATVFGCSPVIYLWRTGRW